MYKCKKCDMQMDTKKHFEIHKGVHTLRKSRIVEYGDPEFSKDKLR
jgi:hypothetical protein